MDDDQPPTPLGCLGLTLLVVLSWIAIGYVIIEMRLWRVFFPGS